MSWRESCLAAGGTPVPDDGKGNGPSCRFIRGTPPRVTYQAASMGLLERLAFTTGKTSTAISERKDRALGAVVTKRDEVVQATGLDHGLTGVAGKLLGIPSWMVGVIALGVLAAYVLPRGGMRSWD